MYYLLDPHGWLLGTSDKPTQPCTKIPPPTDIPEGMEPNFRMVSWVILNKKEYMASAFPGLPQE